MSKLIKVEEKVYSELSKLKGRGETFSQIIGRLLLGRLMVFELLYTLGDPLKYREWQQERLDIMTRARAERADREQEVRDE